MLNILYGVQATGNGHISRSREIIKNLKDLGNEVKVILSGREHSLLWDIETFEPYEHLRGLTFSTYRGKIQYFKTALNLKIFEFYRDIWKYDASGIDLVVTDFEPISARIASKNNIPSIGVGHQYAFLYDVPTEKANLFSKFIIKNFAPVTYPIGLHWHHFDQPILPPIVPVNLANNVEVNNAKIIVYLPFEELDDIVRFVVPFKHNDFYIYHNLEKPHDIDNLHYRPYSRNGFLQDLLECNGVISNAGFELISEALYLGKKILIKPLSGQMEQTSNSKAIYDLELGFVMEEMILEAAEEFLNSSCRPAIQYPDVAKMIAEFIHKGFWTDIEHLKEQAWRGTKQ